MSLPWRFMLGGQRFCPARRLDFASGPGGPCAPSCAGRVCSLCSLRKAGQFLREQRALACILPPGHCLMTSCKLSAAPCAPGLLPIFLSWAPAAPQAGMGLSCRLFITAVRLAHETVPNCQAFLDIPCISSSVTRYPLKNLLAGELC